MSSNNKKAIPEARAALDQFKYEVANEIGVPLKKGYNGDLTSYQNGNMGGYMVKKILTEQHTFERKLNKSDSTVPVHYKCTVGVI